MALFDGSTSNVALSFLRAAFWGLDTAVDVEATPIHSANRYSQQLGNGFVVDIYGTGLTYVADNFGIYDAVSGIVNRVTLTDQSGAKVYDFSGFSETMESLNAATSWTAIMQGVLKGNDSIKGGSGDDFLYGYDGIDTLEGGAGADHLYGGAGDDVLKGGPGDDETFDDLFGGAGNDTLDGTGGFSIAVYSDATGAINANFATGKVTGNASVGTDTLINISEVYGSIYADTLLGSDGTNYFTGNGGNDFISGGAGIDGVIYDTRVSINLATGTASDGLGGTDTLQGIEDVYGSDWADTIVGDNGANLLDGAGGDDSLTGGGGNDALSGGDGNDILNGGLGADSMAGDAGNDTYYVDNAGDKVVESIAALATGGTDLVNSSISYTLGANVEHLRLTGTGAINGTGNASNNTIYAGVGVNVIDGGAGIDTLSYAYAFGTTASGGVTLNLSLLNASGYATAAGSSGADQVKNIENVIGSTTHDTLIGNNVANTLNGGLGNDTLDGKAGADTLIGGEGDDVYYVDNAGDKVLESVAAATTGGTDLVVASASHVLSANVENLRLTAGAINGTGNGLNNVIYAGSGLNVIDGAAGIDTLSYTYAANTSTATGTSATAGVTLNLSLLAASGYATAAGISGADKVRNIENVIGSNYDDALTGNAGVNTLNGGSGNDTLDGKAGADTLVGGYGNDTYYVDNVGDKVVELVGPTAAGGMDLVVSSVSHVLGDNVENLRLIATGTVNGTGNDLNNVIYAGAGANVIDGGAGIDTLSYAFATSTGTGTAVAGVTVNLSVVNTSGYAGASGISGADRIKNIENVTGSNFNDVLTGNAGANVLTGGAGNDTISGGAGNDILDGGAGLDAFVINTALSATANVDTIRGFAAGDTIRLENAIFAKLAATGALKASFFAANAGGKAADADDYIVVETDTGKVFYDADGSGAAAAIHFATLTGMPAVTAADFAVI